jgi:hypothetical protein
MDRVRLAAVGLLMLCLGACHPDDEVCANYGFTPGTDGFGNCMLERQQMRMQAYEQMNNSLQQNLQRQQEIMQETQRALTARQPATVNTNCYTYGNATNCQSNAY